MLYPSSSSLVSIKSIAPPKSFALLICLFLSNSKLNLIGSNALYPKGIFIASILYLYVPWGSSSITNSAIPFSSVLFVVYSAPVTVFVNLNSTSGM